MKTELSKDLHQLQSKMSNNRSDKQCLELKERMKLFMGKTNRRWSDAMIYLLNKGLSIEEENAAIIKKARS